MVVYDTLRSDASEDFWVHKWVSTSLESFYLVHPGRWTLMNAKSDDFGALVGPKVPSMALLLTLDVKYVGKSPRNT